MKKKKIILSKLPLTFNNVAKKDLINMSENSIAVKSINTKKMTPHDFYRPISKCIKIINL